MECSQGAVACVKVACRLPGQGVHLACRAVEDSFLVCCDNLQGARI